MLIRIDEPAIPYQRPDFRLLYVGSDQQWLAALRKVLRKPEIHIVSCPDRGSAILFLKGDARYHLLLFELDLRGTTGLELARLARSLPHREKLPIIIVAGEEITDQLEELARSAEASEYLTKTGDISLAAASVQRHLRTSPLRPLRHS
jgi:DNA-binding response OmpR family regulator